MGQVSIILIAGLVFLFSLNDTLLSILESVNYKSLWFALVLIIVPGTLAFGWGKWLSRKSVDMTPSRFFLIKRSFLIFELILLAGFVADLYFFDMALAVDDLLSWMPFAYIRRLISILPLLAGMVAIKLAQYEVEGKIGRSLWSRREYLSVNTKFLLLPILPLFAYMAVNDVIERLPLQARLFFIENPYLHWLVLILLIVTLYVKAPQLLQGIWRATPLEDGQLKWWLNDLARKNGIRCKEIMVWHTGRARIANAGVAGLLPWSRKVFLTDWLLANFSASEIETIVAHEFGHIKHKHVWIYLSFSFSYFLAAVLYYVYLSPLWKQLLGQSAVVDAISSILFFYLYFVLVFRYLSRRLEHQADLYAVSITGNPEAFKTSLLKLAELSYIPKTLQRIFELTLTHPSIEKRIELVDDLVNGEPKALRYFRVLPEVKLSMILSAVVLFVLVTFGGAAFESEADIHYMRASQFHRERMWDESLMELDKAIESDPSHKESYLLRAIVRYNAGYPEEALADLEKLQSMVTDPDALAGLDQLIAEIKGRSGSE